MWAAIGARTRFPQIYRTSQFCDQLKKTIISAHLYKYCSATMSTMHVGGTMESLISDTAELSIHHSSATAGAVCTNTLVNAGCTDLLHKDAPSSLEAVREAPDIISIAPMMEWTTRHYRFMIRMLTKRTRLYTEMIVDKTLIYSKVAQSFLLFDPVEHPIVCQLGGSEPEDLAKAAKMVEAAGYDEINLNCGCPSTKVAGKGCFGAALMRSPELVRDCVAAMKAVVSIPISVKCRLGVDDLDSYEAFSNFIRVVAESGCSHFVVHARKCLLKGLSTKDNRTIPPLRYHWVQRAALEFPHLRISINGGVSSLAQAQRLLSIRTRDSGECSATTLPEGTPRGSDGFPADPMLQLEEGCLHDSPESTSFGQRPFVLDSVMIGRMAYNDPWQMADVDRRFFGTPNPGFTRRQIIEAYVDYAEHLLTTLPEEYIDTCTYRPMEFGKPLLCLFHSRTGGAKFRAALVRGLTELKMPLRDAVKDALVHVTDEALDELPPNGDTPGAVSTPTADVADAVAAT